MTASESGKLLVIDGNSLLYRAFYALPPMQSRRGEHTNAVYGFTNMLLKLLEAEEPDYAAVAFDPPRPSFRVQIDQSYKAQREKTPDELAEQIGRTRAVLAALGVPVFEVEDFEADDVIGTISRLADDKSHRVTVVSGDADLLQLVNDAVTVMLTKKGISSMEKYDRKKMTEQYGLTPEQFIDYKALRGDPSDNIPGVPGVGEKTARSLLEQYGSIEGIYENLAELKGRVAANLEQYRDDLQRGRKLVRLRLDVPLDLDWEDLRYGDPDREKLLEIFDELDFRSLANRFKEKSSSEGKLKEENNAILLKSQGELESLLKKAESKEVSLLLQMKQGRPYWRQLPRIIGLSISSGQGYYIDPENFIASGRKSPLKAVMESLTSHDLKILTHDAKLCHHLFCSLEFAAPPITFDTFLGAYLADPARGRFGLDELFNIYLGLEADNSARGKKKEQTIAEAGPFLAEQARQLFALRDTLSEQLAEYELEKLLYELELPLAGLLSRMERRGLTVDEGYLRDLSAEICSRLEKLEKEIHLLAGEEFNINSPQQLAKILFDKLGLPAARKTKTGRSTDAKVLEELAQKHDIAGLLLHYRQLAKLEGTYLSGLIDLIDQKEGKIYTTLNQAATATGRLSSSDPNLQNIPIRMEEGRRIRRAFVPGGNGKIYFAADYSQVELRILAHLSQDPILVEAFKGGEDIHRRTAAEVNGIDLEEVTPLMREKAKAVNFGIIYGSSDYGLAQGLKIARSEAKAYIDSYFERYSGVREYMDRIIAETRDKGYVTTILNRRRYLPEINSSNHNTRSFAERMALNTPIQGSAADIIKMAMIKIDEIIEGGGFKAEMLLQIHDELLFQIDQGELDFFAPLIQKEMEEAYDLTVPLKVDLKWGPNWEELKKL